MHGAQLLLHSVCCTCELRPEEATLRCCKHGQGVPEVDDRKNSHAGMTKYTMKKLQLLFLLTFGLLTGCGQVMVFGHTIGERPTASKTRSDTTSEAKLDTTAKSDAAVAPPVAVKPVTQLVKSVSLALAPQAAAKIANDPRFNADALLDAVKNELRSRKLLDEPGSDATAAAEISIYDFAAKPTSNAVVLGYIISDGLLTGEVRLHADGNDLRSYRIEANSKLSIAANGKDPDPLGPLYRHFAVLAADRLAGVPSKPDKSRDQLGR